MFFFRGVEILNNLNLIPQKSSRTDLELISKVGRGNTKRKNVSKNGYLFLRKTEKKFEQEIFVKKDSINLLKSKNIYIFAT